MNRYFSGLYAVTCNFFIYKKATSKLTQAQSMKSSLASRINTQTRPISLLLNGFPTGASSPLITLPKSHPETIFIKPEMSSSKDPKLFINLYPLKKAYPSIA
jgi:hypothetical protein